MPRRRCGRWWLLWLAAGVITEAVAVAEPEAVNPHWASRGDACLECHQQVPHDRASATPLRTAQIDALCNRCHSVISKSKYIHASGMRLPEVMYERMPSAFRQALGGDDGRQITCKVCHEISYQCLESEYGRRQDNPRFHRLAPYQSRTEMCYFCHDKSKYQRLNPHPMTDEHGQPRDEACGYCHVHLLDVGGLQSARQYSAEQKREFDRGCLNCHADDAYAVGCVPAFDAERTPLYYGATPAPLPPAPTSQLPADFLTRGIFCGTCHNVHPASIARPAQSGQGVMQHRQLRIRAGEQPLCAGCHDAKDMRGFTTP